MRTATKKGDIWLIAGALAVAVWLFALLWLLPGSGVVVEITVDGQTYATLPLDTPATLRIPAAGEGYCLLTVADGVATVTEATCPDQICVRHRSVSRVGQSIVCLPARVVVTVVGDTLALDGEV